MKLYVGNLSFKMSEDELRDLFAAHGEVVSAQLIMDRETGRPRGFGFIEMSNSEQGTAAMAALNGADILGRPLTVNEATPKPAGGAGGGSRGGFGGGGGGGGGGRGGYGGGGSGGGGGGRGGYGGGGGGGGGRGGSGGGGRGGDRGGSWERGGNSGGEAW